MMRPRSLLSFRMLVSLFAAMVLLFGAAACGNDDDTTDDASDVTDDTATDDTDPDGDSELDQLIAAAQEEGSLTWYSVPAEAIAQEVSDAFEAEFGISVEFQRLATSDLSTRYAAEAETGSPVADAVVVSNTPFVVDANENGWVVPLADSDIPGFPGDYPAEFLLEDRGTAIVSIEPTVISYNTDRVSEDELPETWADLADPAWEGRILLVDPAGSPAYIDFWTVVMEAEGEEVLEGIAANAVRTYPSGVPLHEALGAGEGDIGVPGVGSIAIGAADRGAPVDYVTPSVTTGPEIVVLLSDGAENPNAARLFAWFLMYGEGQSIINGLASTASPATGDGMPADYTRTPPGAQANRDLILELLGVG
jgi:iron(III) transport system substrate-binding protein